VICACLQLLLGYAPQVLEPCDGNATEGGQNCDIGFREQQKTRPRGPGVVLSCRRKPEPEKAESIFRDDRSRRQAVELVAELGLNLIFGQMMPRYR
jgi:hypothetical protein